MRVLNAAQMREAERITIDDIQKATSDTAIRTYCPAPVRVLHRSAARRLVVASAPVIASHAGSRWLNGTARFRGPVAHAKPVAGFTV